MTKPGDKEKNVPSKEVDIVSVKLVRVSSLRRIIGMEIIRSTVNEYKTERYSYKMTWIRSKKPKLTYILTKFPVNDEPGMLDLTTMLLSYELYGLGGYDGFILVNLTSRVTPLEYKQLVNLTEAGVIFHLQLPYNITLKKVFPIENAKSYSEIYFREFDGISTEFGIEDYHVVIAPKDVIITEQNSLIEVKWLYINEKEFFKQMIDGEIY